jgi:hypothetical protein
MVEVVPFENVVKDVTFKNARMKLSSSYCCPRVRILGLKTQRAVQPAIAETVLPVLLPRDAIVYLDSQDYLDHH